MINLPETIPEFAIKHLIEWSHLSPSSGRGEGLIKDKPRLHLAGEPARTGFGGASVTPDRRGFCRSQVSPSTFVPPGQSDLGSNSPGFYDL